VNRSETRRRNVQPRTLTLAVGIATGYGLGSSGTLSAGIRLAAAMWSLYGLALVVAVALIVVLAFEASSDAGRGSRRSKAYLRSLAEKSR